MSQPKRRSRKTKLVPRATEGGDIEECPNEEVIEMEGPNIKIVNAVSLASSHPEPKKPESIQFKVDIEVEEWIDDELFIEENFAKMQSEKLSQALDKEIQEEADWTNDEYGKLWAETASDNEIEDKPLNEYEKLIKNVIDPSFLAGPSKARVVSTKERENHETEKSDATIPKTKVDTDIRKSELNMTLKAPTVPLTYGNQSKRREIDKSRAKPKIFDQRLKMKDFSKNLATVSNAMKERSRKSKIQNADEDKPCDETSNAEKVGPFYYISDPNLPNRTMSDRSETETISLEQCDTILNRPIYFIELDNTIETVNKKQLREDPSSEPTPPNTFQQVVVSEDTILSVANELSDSTNPVDQILNIELRNRIGSTRFVPIPISREDAFLTYVLRLWYSWVGSKRHQARSVPVLYKCYICNEGWWHLYPFREHIKRHELVQVTLEKLHQECNIVASRLTSKSMKFRMFPIDSDCWKCGKGYASHLGIEKHSYVCNACHSLLYTCLGLKEHEGVCLNIWKEAKQKVKDVKAYKCKICPQIFFTEEGLHKHQYAYHVPRSDYPTVPVVRFCTACNQGYHLYTFHYCGHKLQKYVCKYCTRHFPSHIACDSHIRMTKSYVKCKFCPEVLEKECGMMEHLLTHTDKYMLMYKCLMCKNNTLLKDIVMVKRHTNHIHKSLKLLWGCTKVIIPRICYVQNELTIRYKSTPAPPNVRVNNLIKRLLKGKMTTDSEGNTSNDDLETQEQEESNASQDSSILKEKDNTNEVDASKDSDAKYTVDSNVNDTEDSNVKDTENINVKDAENSNVKNAEDCNVTDNEPVIKTENIMDSYYEEDYELEIVKAEFKPDIAEHVKIEVTDFVGGEIYAAELVDITMPKDIKEEEPEQSMEIEDSPNKFKYEMQNFLGNLGNENLNGEGSSMVGLQCEAKDNSKDSRSLDIEKETKNGFPCTKCNKTYKSMRAYAVHLPRHDGWQYCECHECGKAFANIKHWIMHITMHINVKFSKIKLVSKDIQLFKCTVCQEIVRKHQFFTHWESHLDDCAVETVSARSDWVSRVIEYIQTTVRQKVPKNCIVCGRYFIRMNEKKRHLVEHLLQAAAADMGLHQALLCQICGAAFLKNDHFRHHMRDHAGLTVYHCELCGKTFSDSSNFVKHKKVHNLGSYICDVCNKKFVAKTTLAAHIASHREEPLLCVRCPDKQFYCESSYRRHVRLAHDRATHYSCYVCKRRFTSTRDKWDHQWAVHRIRAQKADCPVCHAKFRKMSDVKKHILERHKDVVTDK